VTRLACLAALAALLVVVPSAAADELPGVAGFGLGAAPQAPSLAPAAVPAGFDESVAWSGLTNPTSIRFAPDGRVFVAEKSGLILTFDDVDDTTPTVYADLRTQVHDFWDRGLLGLALDPGFDSGRPYVYVLYTYNKDPRSPDMPRWPDGCPSPPGATDQGCVVSGRLSRLSGGTEQVLLEGWCQQFPSHSVGDLVFGSDGALYVSGGDGASFNYADFGQVGGNPCGDPVDEGGALRAQDVRSTGDPTGLNGSVLRLDPDTGEPLPDNPGTGDLNARRVDAIGFRNPFRMTMKPGTSDLYVGDVGWNTWEEIDRIHTPTDRVRNMGWPCYEGSLRQDAYDALDLPLCESLYDDPQKSFPLLTYNHNAKVVPGEACPTGSSSISGLAFAPAGNFPAEYEGDLFFSDYSRSCIWVMDERADGTPDATTVRTFAAGATGVVNLQFGPDGSLYYPDLNDGTIKRIAFENHSPVARATATPASGQAPLDVEFDGTGSTDPDGDSLTYAWDLDGDGDLDDSTAAKPAFHYTTAGVRTVRLRVTDVHGDSDATSLTVTVGAPPTVSISTPAASRHWVVDDLIGFSGSAKDSHGTALPASALSWKLDLRHCSDATTCHTHPLETFTGVASGSFRAPDHEYPSYLELTLTATDSSGLSASKTLKLNPTTVALYFRSSPSGLRLSVGSGTQVTPFAKRVIVGSSNSLGAPSPQTQTSTLWRFSSWSDGGGMSHNIVAPATATTYTATFADRVLAGEAVTQAYTTAGEAGVARAYRTPLASASGALGALNVRVNSDSTATAIVAGVYADAGGQPGALLASGRLNSPSNGHWNRIPLTTGASIVQGDRYWIAMLAPSGTVRVRSTSKNGWVSRAAGSGLTALPSSWNPAGAPVVSGRLSAAAVEGP
jgi:glucose/arabinose dehydrogenase